MPGPPRPRARVPLLLLPPLLLALAARGSCAAPAPSAEDLSLGVVSARRRVACGGTPSIRAPWTYFLGRTAEARPWAECLARAHAGLGKRRRVPFGPVRSERL